MPLSDYLKFEPFPYQKEGVQFSLNHHYMILGDEMGLGKTYQAIAVACITKSQAVVVCPAYLKQVWRFEIEKLVKSPSCKVLTKSDLGKTHREQFIIISYSQLKDSYPCLVGRNMVIGDEIHYVKNPKAQRTEHLHDILEGLRPERFMGLSGTPVKNRISEYYSVLGLCSYNRYKTSGKCLLSDYSYWRFCETFSIKSEIRLGRRKITKYNGMRNVPLLKSYLRGKYLRRTADAILDLPELVEKHVMVSYKSDAALEKAWEAHKQGKAEAHVSSAKKASAVSKVKFTCDYVGEILDQSGAPVVVFTEHPDAVTQALHHINGQYSVGIITGSTPVENRQEIVEKLQAGKLDILWATIGSASTGFTMHKASNVVFNDISWVPGDNDQAKKRIHRIGQTKTCFVHYIMGSKVDMMIYKNVCEKQNVLEEIL